MIDRTKEIAQNEYINRKGKLSTGLIQYPSKRWGIVGAVPYELTVEKPYHLGGTFRDGKVFQTKEEADKALTALGFSTKDGINYSNGRTE